MVEQKEVIFTKNLAVLGSGSMGFIVPREVTTAYDFKEGDFFEIKIKKIEK